MCHLYEAMVAYMHYDTYMCSSAYQVFAHPALHCQPRKWLLCDLRNPVLLDWV